ncbi:2-succinyl-5-enolpyruvyl-6-hydroxy-3-cyclohexene-1-carboxylic-acid synthase [Vibrio sp. WXL103]|uniref:2-succinyl-5-enolpyruvyl-6-hydroxy-3- cyclohexene-1-carboxylic-acid synthase n=1 Tax=Vibrio sp. WXL103 TaxID=3450710 RepID=UPI003EC50685
MSQEQSQLNRVWSHIVLEELYRHGVRDVCVAPGSRSTPLTLEADAHPNLRLHTHFDERGLGFYALGLAKSSTVPVAIIVTSGTAVANLLPAIVESGLTKEQLIVLSADRPQMLIDCGANQAINQIGIFSSHVAQSIDLPSPSRDYAWLLTTLDQALFNQQQSGGSLHINCPFPEPLYGEVDCELLLKSQPELEHWLAQATPYCRIDQRHAAAPIDWALTHKKGVLILGRLKVEQAEQALLLAERLGWPVLADPQSGVSSDWAHYDLWLQTKKGQDLLQGCEWIVQLGDRVVSKRLNQWIERQVRQHHVSYKLISESNQRLNPDHLAQYQVITKIDSWLASLIEHLSDTQPAWCQRDEHWQAQVAELVAQQCLSDSLTELGVARWVTEQKLAKSLFIGNSLIVRLVDMVGRPKSKQVYTNRGASGIDGLVATMAGVQAHQQQPMIMVLGDTSLLHDLNSLALLKQQTAPTLVIVTNNDGGAIFDLLPVPTKQKSSLYQMPHGFDFQHAALQFGLEYSAVDTLSELERVAQEHFSCGRPSCGRGARVIEVSTPPDQAFSHIKQLVASLAAL